MPAAALFAAVLLLGLTATGQDDLDVPRSGVGAQFTLPPVAGISVRQWGEDGLGWEAALFILSFAGDAWGTAAVRGLVSLSANARAALYAASCGSYLLPDHQVALHLCLGVELPLAGAAAVNAEFGLTWLPGLGTGMALGSAFTSTSTPRPRDTGSNHAPPPGNLSSHGELLA
ncbi:MAG: hypothetical protein ACP5G2_04910 [Candidatus Bipolaricaulaceae bacterium]